MRAGEDPRGEAHTLTNTGYTYCLLGELQKALEYFTQALPLIRNAGDREGEAIALNNIGVMSAASGEPWNALEYFTQALSLVQAIGVKGVEASSLGLIAIAQRNLGNLAEARARIEAAVSILESQRTKVRSDELRTSFFASKQSYYELYVDLLMRLHQQQPTQGHDAVALQASERARARSLLESLVEARADIRQGVDPHLLERERSLQQQLNGKEQYRMQLLSRQHTEEQAEAAKKELDALLTQYQEVQGQIRATSPRYAALTQPQPLSLKEIQQQVLDEDTLLLEYASGEEQSYLWAVTPTTPASFELPKRSEIEAAAKRVYESLTARNQWVKDETAEQRRARIAKAETEFPQTAAALSQMILGPVAGQLGTKRLLIVSDGALQYVPFAALPRPLSVVSGQWSEKEKSNGQRTTDNGQKPLIVDHEIVSLPSASVLAVQRKELAGRKPAAKTVAVLADPVFEKDDERVKAARVKAEAKAEQPAPQVSGERILTHEFEKSASETGVVDVRLRIPRLPYTREEANGILALAAKEARLKALDFTANRATATSHDVSQYRMVHFATHGLLNSQHPELSGIVLSLVNEKGEPQDGYLRLHDVYNMNLPAELVVLSACQTGLGKEIEGEGLVGLTRGFMYAGAARVVVSLWSVNDQATAELMEQFYKKMLKDGQRPAAALRQAQISMWKEKRWQSPYYWAAFVLQGEWR
jgi:CHAT domain-containing protein